MAEPSVPETGLRGKKMWRMIFAVSGIMTTLVIYGLLQEKIMRVPYGVNREYFRYSLFLVFCNRLTTSAVSAGSLLASKKALNPVAPVYKYCLVSVSNILTTTCQYEALKYVSFPVQTLAKCAKMIPVMIWGTIIMQKRYKGPDYLFAFLVTLGCSVFILFPAGSDISPYNRGRENTVWGVSLMISYLGFDGFTSTFQDKLFKGYDMEIHNQIFYTAFCSCVLSFTGEFPVYLKSNKTVVVKNLAFGVLGSMMVLESVLASASVGFGQIC
ncbi:UDP-galactose/UDP-glucose transporter 5B-like [Pistacia vera]|uniref:UDP-galactose/UDP-glucose transporter 5B-like n=1 Tax=Pistacia vera TaxID=55513 RepID=UPI001262B1B0|nr:UDP-galactose/UDP-glucose transporter 5B-like [Pistacia vera]XP_031247527.1 UDP-galactose/UDP-glucose transporter 5B-like [Pistacia vera]